MVDPLWIDFANSDWHDWKGSGRSQDRLFDETWQLRFLERWNWPHIPLPTPNELQAAKVLRDALRATGFALVHGHPVAEQTIALVNDILSRSPQYVQLESTESGYQIRHTTTFANWSDLLGQIAASFAAMLVDGDTERLRICANPDCLWLFQDTTRNGSKRYCDDKMCGNLAKVRRFRARQKSPSQ